MHSIFFAEFAIPDKARQTKARGGYFIFLGGPNWRAVRSLIFANCQRMLELGEFFVVVNGVE